MKELEYLRQKGTLITENQYKKILLIIIINFTLSAIICLGGMAIMLLSDSHNLLIIGLSIFLIGTFLLIFDVVFTIIKYAAKIQLYRHYKKYPEDFESEIEL